MAGVNRISYMEVVWRITEELRNAEKLEEALRSSLESVVRALGAEAGTIWFYNKNGDRRIYPSFWIGSADLSGFSLAPGEGIAGAVVESGETTVVRDCQKDRRWAGRFDAATGFVTRSMICVPLANKYETIGCIQIINKKDGSLFEAEDVSLCENLSMLAAIAIDAKDLILGIQEQKPVVVSLRDIKKEFVNGENVTQVLKGINLDVYEGEFLVLLGESGCGKSTLLNIIGGMDHPSSGSFYFEGRDYSQADDKALTAYRRRHIGFIFQSYNLMPNLTARENLEFVAELCVDPLNPRKALEMVGLAERAGYYPSQMSGGQQQRVSIARALVKKPRLILADEPTAALDYATSVEVLSVMERIVGHGATLIMVTHNEEITKMANRIIRLRNGVVSDVFINKHPAKAAELVW